MSRENVNVAAPTLCMTTPTGVCGIDLDGPHVISPPPVPTTAAPRIAPRLRVPIAGAIADLIAGVMTEPDRLSTASAIAQTSGYSAVAHPNVKPLSRPEHDRMANAIRALAMDAVEQAKSGHPGLPMGAADIATVTPPIRLGRIAIASCSPPATGRCCSTHSFISSATKE